MLSYWIDGKGYKQSSDFSSPNPKVFNSWATCRGSSWKSNILSHRWLGWFFRELVKPEPSSAMTNYGKHFGHILPLPTRFAKVARTKQCMLGFETALNARVIHLVDVKVRTKKSQKYSYLLTQEHKTWTIRAEVNSVMWVWNPTSEQLIEVAIQLINPPPRYKDWKSSTANCRKNISLRCLSEGRGDQAVTRPGQY